MAAVELTFSKQDVSGKVKICHSFKFRAPARAASPRADQLKPLVAPGAVSNHSDPVTESI
jgi:hypothetical protein